MFTLAFIGILLIAGAIYMASFPPQKSSAFPVPVGHVITNPMPDSSRLDSLRKVTVKLDKAATIIHRKERETISILRKQNNELAAALCEEANDY